MPRAFVPVLLLLAACGDPVAAPRPLDPAALRARTLLACAVIHGRGSDADFQTALGLVLDDPAGPALLREFAPPRDDRVRALMDLASSPEDQRARLLAVRDAATRSAGELRTWSVGSARAELRLSPAGALAFGVLRDSRDFRDAAPGLGELPPHGSACALRVLAREADARAAFELLLRNEENAAPALYGLCGLSAFDPAAARVAATSLDREGDVAFVSGCRLGLRRGVAELAGEIVDGGLAASLLGK